MNGITLNSVPHFVFVDFPKGTADALLCLLSYLLSHLRHWMHVHTCCAVIKLSSPGWMKGMLAEMLAVSCPCVLCVSVCVCCV